MDNFAVDTVIAEDLDKVANFPTELLNRIESNRFFPYKLTLKVGSISCCYAPRPLKTFMQWHQVDGNRTTTDQL